MYNARINIKSYGFNLRLYLAITLQRNGVILLFMAVLRLKFKSRI